MIITDAMVKAALSAHIDASLSDRQTAMRAALTAALSVSGYGEVVEAARAAKKYLEPDLVEPGRTVFWKLVAALSRLPTEPQR